MRIAICDDEQVQRMHLRTLIEQFMKERNLPFSICEYETADQFFLSYDVTQPFDIAVLDIQMQGMNGMELAKRLRASNERMAILFVTGVTDYIYDSFDVNAINYLLKPYQQDRFFSCMEKALAQCQKEEAFVVLQVEKELIKVKESSLLYVESDGHYIMVVTSTQTYRIKKTMTQFQQELQGTQIYRLGRSYLINLMAIDRITSNEIFLMNGANIWIPKGKHKEVSQAFMEYHFHQERS